MVQYVWSPMKRHRIRTVHWNCWQRHKKTSRSVSFRQKWVAGNESSAYLKEISGRKQFVKMSLRVKIASGANTIERSNSFRSTMHIRRWRKFDKIRNKIAINNSSRVSWRTVQVACQRTASDYWFMLTSWMGEGVVVAQLSRIASRCCRRQ